MIRDRRPDGTQSVARIAQIAQYRNIPLSIQWSAFDGYASPQNTAMGPYVYVGLIPKANTHAGGTEGYNEDGHDLTFVNCDANINSYFTFLFNANKAQPSPYHPTNSELQRHWITAAAAVPSSQNLPDAYFSFFEMHFGGCGAYGTPQHLPQTNGAAVGLRYGTMCRHAT